MASRVNIKPPCQGILLKDRISELPPEILVVILSQLEMKEAARTSILSRRWRYMWTQISNLRFDASEVLDEIKLETKCLKVERPAYITHVNQVINHHQGQNIDQFVAVFDLDKSSGSDIDNWVSYAIRKRVRKLKLDLMSSRRNLQRNRYRFPDSVEVSSCSSLTSLHLSEVEITGDMLQRFLHNCLNLESLYVQGTTNVRSLNVNGPSLKLKWLELSNCTRIECLNVSAPNLVSFKYKGPKIEMPLKDVPKLFEVSVSGFYGRYLNQRLSELSNCLSQLEKLTLEASTFRKYMIEDARFPVFPKVKHLTLTITTLCLDGILDCPSMISACPSLYKFSWETWCKFYDAELEPFKAGAYPPHGIKVVEFVGFRCEPFEIDLAKYLIKTAVMLEKISFDTVSPLYKGRRLLDFRQPENRISAKECAREIGRMLPPSVQLVIEDGLKRQHQATLSSILLKDRITELPPEILVDILSQLEKKEAVRTITLSRTWRYMWTKISNLSFDASEVVDEIQLKTKRLKVERPVYITHVNQVINHHQGQNIDQFVAVFDLDKSSGSDIDNWVSFAIRKRVRKLKLDLSSWRCSSRKSYRFPDSLEVSSCSSLTSLHLAEVEITGDMLQRFLHNCLNLESLFVGWSDALISLNVNGPSLKLKWLELSNCNSIECLNVSAPNLVSFKYEGPKIEMPLKDVPKLLEVSVKGFYTRYLNQRLSELSNYLSQLEKLTLEACKFRKHMTDARFPVFPKVKHLTLTIASTVLDGILDCASMIIACPLYRFSWETWTEFYEDEMEPFKAGAYPPHNIRVVEFIGFREKAFEVDLAKYLIENAVLLEKISFDTVSPFYKGRLLEFHEPEYIISAKKCAREIGRMLPPSVQLIIEG